ncbi:mechanosensitive ion channel family protein [Patescibacteria group bacterium]|nr:mechanosensitive ion channel family protein [Patescibacteria group bacterium]MBU0964551.1 mechanosensitive ion channel family protein [Patescibacteria group bacterium]
MQEFLAKEFWNNTMQEYAIALALLVGLIIIFAIFQKFVLYRLEKLAKKTKTDLDDAVIEVFRTIKPPLYGFIVFYIAVGTLSFPDIVQKVIGAILIIWMIIIVTKAAQIFINKFFQKKIEEEEGRGTKSALGAIKIIAKVIIWVLGLLLLLSNLGINITSLVAGLGIGGVAVALALQNILGDLFSSFAIHFDKPFIPGDFVVVGDKQGTVEKIGIKSTRIRALQGEEIVISNQELTSAQIHNFKKMKERKIVFSIGTTYETPTKKLKIIPYMITKIFNDISDARLDRVHFKEFEDSSLNFEIAYYVEAPEYAKYLDIQQEINFKIREGFENESIEMAYPTQTLYVKK